MRRGHQNESPSHSAMRGNEHSADDQGVEKHADADDGAELGEHDQRQHAEDGEHGGQQDAGAGDHPAGRRERAKHAFAGPVPVRLLGRPGDQEDVVVDAQRHEEQERQQRHADVEALEARTRSVNSHQASPGWRRRSPRRWRRGATVPPPSAAAAPVRPAPAPRISGMITSRSRWAPSRSSMVGRPPCRRRGCRRTPSSASRRSMHRVLAPPEPGRRLEDTSIWASPSPLTAATAASHARDCRPRVAGHRVGVVPGEHHGRVGGARPGRTPPAARAAEIASGLSRNWSACARPVWIRGAPTTARQAARACRPRTRRGRAATRSPTRRHSEWRPPGSSRPTCGTRGQKIQRPNSTSSAGSTTSTKNAATTTPTAQARPSPRVVGRPRSSRVSSADDDGGRRWRARPPRCRRRRSAMASYRSS